MTGSPTVTSPSIKPLPRLRSRGGQGAGSPDQPGRRNPREARASGDGSRLPPPSSPARRPVSAPTGEFVEAAKLKLMAHRNFRIHQLDQLAASLPDAVTDAARTEIHLALQAAARSVLVDIDAALCRIRQGSYGRCLTCGSAMSMDRLIALPMVPLCGPCQHTQDLRSSDPSGDPSTGAWSGRDPSAPRIPSARRRDPMTSSRASGCARDQRPPR
jgi:RNA polymerase-binding transcription factor DksA